MAIAFFDVDKTVISVNSATLWLRRELREGHIGWLQALRGVLWIFLYAVGFARLERAFHAAAAEMTGAKEDDIAARTRAFWEAEIRPLVRAGARAAVERHRARGDLIVLLTTSSPYLTSAIAAEIGADAFLCNYFVVEDGRLAGTLREPLCFGEGKVALAAALAAERGVRLADCAFYSDSYSDLPMLLAVGTPVAVHPDARLRRAALRRGWPVERWS